MISNNLYFFACAIIFSPLIGALIKRIFDFFNLTKISKNDTHLGEFLKKITPKEFELWTSDYLSFLGFTNIVKSSSLENCTTLTCVKDSKTFQISCKRKSENYLINIDDIEELLGILVTKNIYNGIIVTTNSLSSEAENYLKTLCTPYKIDVMTLCV